MQTVRRIALMGLIAFSCGCGQRPKVDILASLESDQVVFHVTASDINSIIEFGVRDVDRKPLWIINTYRDNWRATKTHEIRYGVVPIKEENRPSEQRIPIQGERPPDIRARRVIVYVQYKHDRVFDEAIGTFSKEIKVP
jgi:hypothetical protein